MKKDQEYKSLTELFKIDAYRVWLIQMGFIETYDILLEGSAITYTVNI